MSTPHMRISLRQEQQSEVCVKVCRKLRAKSSGRISRARRSRYWLAAPMPAVFQVSIGEERRNRWSWNLLKHFQRLVLEAEPTIVTMENVPRLAEQGVFADFVAGLQGAGYQVHFEVVRCVDYGVPQQRESLVLLASKLGPLRLRAPARARTTQTVRNAIAALPRLGPGQVDTVDPLHRTSHLSRLFASN